MSAAPAPAPALEVALGARSYPIYIGDGLLGATGLLDATLGAADVLVVSNDRVAPLYLEPVRTLLGARRVEALVLPDGEAHKTLERFAQVIDALVAGGFHRDACVVALGGGVIGDLAGFAAACYQRGIACVQIPTTLLAQVDSSVGGKTAVNHPRGKNLVGAFHQPAAVVADIATLDTLPERELAAGLAEVIKYGLIMDAAFLSWLEANIGALRARDHAALAHAVRRSCELKAEIVAADEREHGRRALLNLGHTFGHAIEALAGYGHWLHGEAVGAGMVLAAQTSKRMGWLDTAAVERVRALVAAAGLPVAPPALARDAMLDAMALDKKVVAGRLRLVLLRAPGNAFVTAEVPAAVLAATLDDALAYPVAAPPLARR